jgi:HK97 gp10 family phage protein
MAHYQSRIPAIAAELEPRTKAILAEAAGLVVEGAKARVPVDTGRLHNQIHSEYNETLGAFQVLAGDARAKDFAFYAHIIERGSVFKGARPFLVPAAEQVRAELVTLGRKGFERL